MKYIRNMYKFNVYIIVPLLAVTTKGLYQPNYRHYHPIHFQQPKYINEIHQPQLQSYAGFYKNYHQVVTPIQIKRTPVGFPNTYTYLPFRNYFHPQDDYKGQNTPFSSQFRYTNLQDFHNYYKFLNLKISQDTQDMYQQLRTDIHNAEEQWNKNPAVLAEPVPIHPAGIHPDTDRESVTKRAISFNTDLPVKSIEVEQNIPWPTEISISSSTLSRTTSTKLQEPQGHDENQIVVDIDDYKEYKPKAITDRSETFDEAEGDYNYSDELQGEEKNGEQVVEKPMKLFNFFN